MKNSGIGKHLRIWVMMIAVLSMICLGVAYAENTEPQVVTIKVVPENVPTRGDPAEQYIYRALGWDEMIIPDVGVLKGNAAGANLSSDKETWLYTKLKEKFVQVAAGDLASTDFEFSLKQVFENVSYTAADLGLDKLEDDTDPNVKEAAKKAFFRKLMEPVSRVVNALLFDCPYDLYWFDKTEGYGMSSSYYIDKTNGTIQLPDYETDTFNIYFTVAGAYAQSGADEYTVNTTKAKSIQSAAITAQGIVNQYASSSDYWKLLAYKDRICGLTDYNHAAADNDNTPYGDPWQLIYVFDGDTSTKVVCEGYSKAFQYLCDLSQFNNASAISVSGTMSGGTGAGRHMWNIVTLNGINYLADITNSDEGSAGQDGELFLTGYTGKGTASNGSPAYFYTVGKDAEGKDIYISYVYNDDTLTIFGTDEGVANTLLDMTDTAFPIPDCTAHQFQNGVCTICGYACVDHDFDAYGHCRICQYQCPHDSWEDGHCTVCSAQCYTVSFSSNGGKGTMESITVANGATCDLPENAFTRHGFCFNGWKDNNNQTYEDKATIASVTTNLTLTAQWEIDEQHTLTYVPAKNATCVEAGNSEYWTCKTCKKYFRDAAGENEIEENSWVIPTVAHHLTGTSARSETCTDAGNYAYWICDVCKKHFRDEAGEAEFAENAWIIPASGHNLSETPARDATCTEAGNAAGWTCETCGKHFSDAAGETEIAENNWITPSTGHDMTATSATAATCEEAGNSKYWTCGNCKKYFSDADGNTEIAENSWVINALGHAWNAPTYVWSSDNATVTATRTCQNGDHPQMETKATTSEITSPTETTAGSFKWVTLAFDNNAFTRQEKAETIKALGEMEVLYLPSSLITIETEAFDNVAAEAIIVPDTVRTIQPKAFTNCKNLMYIRIPARVTVLDNMFEGSPNVIVDQK